MSLLKYNSLLFLVLVALTIIKANTANTGNGNNEGSEGNNRLMLARCNYTELGARSCASCQEVMLCTPLDVGIVRRCSGSRRHCSQGACSETPSGNCNSTSPRRFHISGRVTVHF